MVLVPDPAEHVAPPTGWKRQPIALWFFLALGAGRIVLSGVELVLDRRKR